MQKISDGVYMVATAVVAGAKVAFDALNGITENLDPDLVVAVKETLNAFDVPWTGPEVIEAVRLALFVLSPTGKRRS